MYWQSKSKVIILERAESVSPKLALMLKSVDFSTGTDLKDVEKFNRTGERRGAEGAGGERDGRGEGRDQEPRGGAGEDGGGADVVDAGAEPGGDAGGGEGEISSSKVAGMFIPNKVTVVLGEDNAYGRGDREYSKLHVVRLGSGWTWRTGSAT
eukprot:Sspe_Gene.27966::Locus_12404_Transcript_1_1_Confidence_1.000_Length_4108::g.27966::m.27966